MSMSPPPLPATRLNVSLRRLASGRQIWWLEREESSNRRITGMLRRRQLFLDERGVEVVAAAGGDVGREHGSRSNGAGSRDPRPSSPRREKHTAWSDGGGGTMVSMEMSRAEEMADESRRDKSEGASTIEAPAAGHAEDSRERTEAPRPSLRKGKPQDQEAGTEHRGERSAEALEALLMSADLLHDDVDDAGDDSGASFVERLAAEQLARGGAAPGGRILAADSAVSIFPSRACSEEKEVTFPLTCLSSPLTRSRVLQETSLTEIMSQSSGNVSVESELKHDKLELNHCVAAVSQLERVTMFQHEHVKNPSNDERTPRVNINHQLDRIPPPPSLRRNSARTALHSGALSKLNLIENMPRKAQSRTSNLKSNLQTPQKHTCTRQQDHRPMNSVSTDAFHGTRMEEPRDKPAKYSRPKKNSVLQPVNDRNEEQTNNPRLGGLTPKPKEKPKASARKCYFYKSPRSRKATTMRRTSRPNTANTCQPDRNGE